MSISFSRSKPRHLLLSIAYKVIKLVPGHGRKLDLLLDIEWISNRLAFEAATHLGLARPSRNCFLIDRIEPTDRVLDVGCGKGSVAGAIEAEVVGIDHDSANLELARRDHPGVTFVHADARDYLKTAAQFDVLLLSHILEHLDDPRGFLASVASHFSRVYIEVPDFDATVLNHVRLKRGRQLVYCDNDHVTEFERTDILRLAASVGLTLEASEYLHGNMKFWFSRKKSVA